MAHPRHEFVRARAGAVCEYCRLPEALYPGPYTTEHIIARQHGGSDRDDNLAYACGHCNLHKGPNIAGLDPATGLLTRLFNPRVDVWNDHSEWSGHILTSRTPVGRTTGVVLAMNDAMARVVRAALLAEGVFPPIPPA
ncbi:HNH endonuclease [Gemmata sp. SH-PL17]|uniref:HNH endonuclease n=1 Tax=Gemmata sp. SH-PL17 TaxID=1630693 RepID=UPI0004B9DDD6|nr:HNH endonuclease signature motif containing protein [Gemmata sp. SH-PL17]AMV23539.1 HNH endonuclease [Gemmata sp. SH-PL17]